ncbi:MAG: membrane protein [Gallionellaceae bacterium]|nr:MAG: membrane protein [Gallionellaceae bacterium]
MSNCLAIHSFRNVLLVQLGDIGDIVLTTPTIRAVREACPGARVSILVFKPYGLLLAADPNIDEVVETARAHGSLLHRLREAVVFVRLFRQRHYDLVIDLRTGDRGAILSFLSRAKERVGPHVGKPFWHDLLFTKIICNLKVAPPPVHPGADQSLRVVRELGITTEDSTPQLYIAPCDRLRASVLLAEAGLTPEASMVTVNPFSRWKYKEWSNAKWGEVIDRLWKEHHISTVIIGSPEEIVTCQEIVAGREGYTISLAGKTTLGELAAVISMSMLHLGVDSAAPHIAAAVGTPTVTIHGPSDWRAWRIVNERHKVVSTAMDCLPCNMMGCDNSGMSRCLEQTQTDPVIVAAGEILLDCIQAKAERTAP